MLQMNYFDYIREYQGLFVINCQMMNIEFLNLQKDTLGSILISQKNFSKTQKKMKMSKLIKDRTSLVFDIENTLVTKLETKTLEELEQLKQSENFTSDYIMIDTRNF